MTAPNPKKWVASKYVNQISYRKVTAGDLSYPRGTFHDTWEEARAAIVARCEVQFAQAEKAFQRTRTALMKAKRMPPPQPKEAA